MPLIQSSYSPSSFLAKNPHLSTIFPNLFRKVQTPSYKSFCITASDGEHLHVNQIERDRESLAIITHGAEGSSQKAYIKGMINYLDQNEIDSLVWHLRGCGPFGKQQRRFYNLSDSHDLDSVVNYASQKKYKHIFLIGFSLGGLLLLNYLGHDGFIKPTTLRKAVALSTPFDTEKVVKNLTKGLNQIYNQYFLFSMKNKLFKKESRLKEKLNVLLIKNLIQIDDITTMPLFSFDSLSAYYDNFNPQKTLESINTPTLIINALNDPILSPDCYPYKTCENHPHLFLETPKYGGHVGFLENSLQTDYWSERRVLSFLRD
ncbi:MAG: YheT family hydrolase [Rhabdochlamydiaceae bacterium]